jgi:PAT family beta-lactamase induction signal transducer AmpG
MEQLFLFKQLGATKYFLLKLVSTFALSFSAIKSGPLIKKFKYKGAFIISIIAGISTIGCYYLCTLKTYSAYSIGIVIASLLFGGFYYIVKKQKRYIIASVLLSIGMVFGLTRWVEIGIISTFATVIIAKMTSGIRSSVLYSYQTALCSKEYALTQVTLMTSVERLLLGFWVQGLSGYFVESFGWSTFYLITLGMSIMPLLLIQLTKYPKVQ